jgi:hypothetical protein
MKRVVLITALLLGGAISAYAGTDVWSGKGSTADMMAAAGACRQQVGESADGVPTTAETKRCMRSLGWKYVTTKHDGTWMRGGRTCHYILNGMGSECSAF